MSSSKSDVGISVELPLAFGKSEAFTTDAIHHEILQLFDECAPGLRRYVRSCGLSADAADDVVQDAFVLLFRHLCLGRSRENLRGWLFHVSFRLALKQGDRVVRQQHRERAFDPQADEAVVDPMLDPEARLTARQQRRRLRSLLHALPWRERQCVALRAEGLRYRQIARVLGISLGSVAKALAYVATRVVNAGKE